MKALVYRRYGGPDVLELADIPRPQPREHEVLVRVHVASVNAADRVLLRGKPFLVRLGIGFPRPRNPTLGFDVAGRVEAVGSHVTQFRVGDDVFGASKFGAFAEHVCVNEETLLSIAVSDALAIVMRPDQQDYQGTAVTVDVAKKLDVPKMLMLINKTPPSLDFDDVKSRVEQIYHAKVAAVLPHSDEMMTLASSGIFSIRFPDNIVTKGLRSLVDQLKS